MSSGFDDLFVVIGGDKKAVKAVKKALKKKLEPQEVWGKAEGYCAWCVDAEVNEPIWEYEIDSQGDSVKYACCRDCAADRGMEGKDNS